MTLRPIVGYFHRELLAFMQLPSDQYEIVALWTEEGMARAGEVRAAVMIGGIPVSAAMLMRLPALELVACYTAGYDGIDTNLLKQRGIALTHSRYVNEGVADHAIGLLIAHRKQFAEGDRRIRAGEWVPGRRVLTRSLVGAKLGIVGLGGIGQAAARRAEAFGMVISWWGPNAKPEIVWQRADSLAALASDSDILLVTASAHSGNNGMISAAIIDMIGPEGMLVNVARGQLVDEDALIRALRAGRLGGAALDVFAIEPAPAERWRDVPNCLLTPHSSGGTDVALDAMARQVRVNLDAFFTEHAILNRIDDPK